MASAPPLRWSPRRLPSALRTPPTGAFPALSAWWRRVRDGLAGGDPAFDERWAERRRGLSGIAAEALELLDLPLSIETLQRLHVVATRDQTAARAVTADGGFKYVPFPYGKLKDKPNHLVWSGRIHQEFCPPEHVAHELGLLLVDVAAIPDAVPELRAAWLVDGFLRIHPFVDGNGRTARLLASQPFLAHGLAPIWGESSERGAGWKETVDHAATTGEVQPLARVLAGHQERLLLRLLAELEAPPLGASLDAVRDRDTRNRAARAAWAPERAEMAARLPGLLDALRPRAEALAHVFDPEATGVPLDADAAARAAIEAAMDSGVALDRRGPAAAFRVTLGAREATLRVAVAAAGITGSGAFAAFAHVRPRALGAPPTPPLLLVPEEDAAAQRERAEAWFDALSNDLGAAVVRLG